LFAGFQIDASRNMLNDNQFAINLKGVCNLSFDNWFFPLMCRHIAPRFEIDPLTWVGFVQRDDLYQGTRWITALDMYRSTRACKSKDETTRTVFVIRIIFDDFCIRYCL
jgi:hypothetical protein